ncbi:MAG: histidine--tRNA ligase [Candidatus Micrarchaeia archaeon]
MQNIPFPRGVRDLMPNEALFKNKILNKIENVYKKFGFLTYETPVFESIKLMQIKGGIGEGSKEVFEIKDEDFALRFDLTLGLARFIAMHQEIPMPFKRYFINKCWRKEEPQKLRYREFTQADVDIVGSRSTFSDAEVIAVQAKVLEELNIDYIIRINDRRFIKKLLESINITGDLEINVMRAIDKLDKLGKDGVLDALQKLGITGDKLDKLGYLIKQNKSNEDALAYINNYSPDVGKELNDLIELLNFYKLSGKIIIDMSLMRGFDYYTGMVVEYNVNEASIKSSIGGGGRYDNLIQLINNKQQVPVVGTSLGIDRILDILGFSDSPKINTADVFVVNVKDNNYKYALQIANELRNNNISVDMNVTSRNISNQLAYANALKYKYAIIVGDVEEKLGNIKIKNLIDGTEQTVMLADVINILAGINYQS